MEDLGETGKMQRAAPGTIFGELMAAALSQEEIEAGLMRKDFCRTYSDSR